MVTDKFWSESIFKLVVVWVLLIYFIVSNSGLSFVLPTNSFSIANTDTVVKKKLGNSKKCFLLLGGSNIKQGGDAQVISGVECGGVNLGLNGEMNSFDVYESWVRDINIEAEIVIYSPSIFWSTSADDVELASGVGFWRKYIPPVSIANQVKTLLKPSLKLSEQLDHLGDVVSGDCSRRVFPPKWVNVKSFNDSSGFITNKIVDRVAKIEGIFKKSKVVLRVPPFYTTQNLSVEYERMMRERILLLRKSGLVFIQQDRIVFINDNFFCDGWHPNKEGRAYFSMEIKESISHLLPQSSH